MLGFEEARRIILGHVAALGPEVVPAVESVGRVLCAPLVAPWDLPLWNNSAMDGYAVRAEDCTGRVALKVTGYVPAGGHSSEPVGPGLAVKILTGAPMPPGADAVVPLEKAQEQEGMVLVKGPVRAGAHVRRRGEDIGAGDAVVAARTVIGPSEVSLFATFARLSIPVFRRARVAILSTGDELVEPGEPLGPGMIYNTNAYGLAAAVKQVGGEPVVLGIARDDRASLAALLRDGFRADALVTSAGISAGDRDLVREVLGELSARQVFYQVDIKPARPTAFAMWGDRPVFSLPGNPVSSLLAFEEFVRPALLKMMGHRKIFRPLVKAVLTEDLEKRPGRVYFVRVRLEERDGTLLAASAGRQETGILRTTAEADGIAVLPTEAGTIHAGATVDVQVVRGGFEMRES